MPADIIPHKEIPKLAATVTPEMLEALRRIQQERFILNGADIDEETTVILRQLVERGLADPGYDGPTNGLPSMWISNTNGARVLTYMTGLRSGPHYEIPSSELATWLEEQGAERWWNVDGDPLLTGKLTFPCPADELAEALRTIDRPLLVQARKEDIGAQGQVIKADTLNAVAGHWNGSIPQSEQAPISSSRRDRVLCLCWKESPDEWLLTEDSETTDQMRAVQRPVGTENARVEQE